MNQALKRKFNEYNRKYFDGILPKDTVVDWHYELNHDASGACHIHGMMKCSQIPKSYGKCEGKHLILINTRLWDDVEQSYMTLLHEMVHLQIGLWVTPPKKSHGPEFQRGMMRLAKAGALARLW